MSALSKGAAEVEREFGSAWTRYHIGAQAARFLSGVLVTLLLGLHNGVSDWTDLLPLIAGAAWATARQMWPQVPWSLVKAAKENSAPSAATQGGVGG